MVFIFSGFVKAVDPAGFAIKFTEYFEAFHLGIFAHIALTLAVLVSATEFMIGLNLIAGLRMKLTAWLLILFMSFFTVLTFILAISNPVSDCGCFGDALKLTNWQTFGKNIILFVPAIIIFLQRKEIASGFNQAVEWAFVTFNLLLSCTVSVYCLVHQPVLDFRPYNIGTYIPQKMVIPEGVETDRYETRLIYEKDGRQQEFSDLDFPWQDTTWKWVETRQRLVKKGYEPPIHDLSITTLDGEDITGKVLSDTGYVFLVIAPDLEKASGKGMDKMNSLALKSREYGFPVYCLTASANSQISAYMDRYQPAFDVCTTDETTLKTIVRANPGLLLLHRGTILDKWNFRDAPSARELSNQLLSAVLLRQHRQFDTILVLALALAVFLVYSLVKGIRH